MNDTKGSVGDTTNGATKKGSLRPLRLIRWFLLGVVIVLILSGKHFVHTVPSVFGIPPSILFVIGIFFAGLTFVMCLAALPAVMSALAKRKLYAAAEFVGRINLILNRSMARESNEAALAFALLGDICNERGNSEEAERLARKGLETVQRRKELLQKWKSQQGDKYNTLNDSQLAEDAQHECLCRVGLSEILYKQRRRDEALSEIQTALNLARAALNQEMSSAGNPISNAPAGSMAESADAMYRKTLESGRPIRIKMLTKLEEDCRQLKHKFETGR